MSPEGSNIRRLLGKIFNNLHEPHIRNQLPQLFAWYESLNFGQLKAINIIIRKKVLSYSLTEWNVLWIYTDDDYSLLRRKYNATNNEHYYSFNRLPS